MGLNLSSLWNVTKPKNAVAEIINLDVQQRINTSLNIARDYIEVHCAPDLFYVIKKWNINPKAGCAGADRKNFMKGSIALYF